MWTEKYRPRTIDEVVMPEEWRREFHSYLPQDGETEVQKKKRLDSIPSMLFTGPPGTGKNTIANVLLNSISPFNTVILGGENPPSVERIRRLEEFFRTIIEGVGMVFIDEADTMAQDAQRALQILIERFQADNRVILATNFPDRIGNALKSRLRVYDFGNVTRQDIRRRVEQILGAEKITLRSDVIDGIIDQHHPDIRKIVQEVERASIHVSNDNTQGDQSFFPLIEGTEGGQSRQQHFVFPQSFFVSPLNKQRIAERVAEYWALLGFQIRCADAKQWMLWKDGVWQIYSHEQMSNSVLQSIREIGAAYEAECKNDPRFIDCLSDLLKAEDQLDSIIKSLSRLPGILTEGEVFNSYGETKFLVCCENGIIDLRDGSLRLADPGLLITKCLPCNYSPEASCSRWLEFLNFIFDENQELIQFVQRALGYSLMGANEAQCMFVMLGEKARNGKSTFLSVVKQILGPDYYEPANASTFTRKPASAKGRVPEDLHRLRTARFVGVVETEQNEQLDVALIKKIAGGDDIVSRTLYKESESYKAPYTVWIATNHMPAIDSNDFGIRRKVWVIPFEMQIPEERVIPNYDEQLLEEREGILAWMVEGCRQYVQNYFDLDPPDGVRPAYKAPDLPFNEKVNYFIEICTEKGMGFSASKEMLWRTFLDFTAYFQMGEVVDSNSHRNQFGRVMSDLGYNEGGANPRVGGETVYKGLRLRTTLEMAQYRLEKEQAEIDKSFDKKSKPKEGP